MHFTIKIKRSKKNVNLVLLALFILMKWLTTPNFKFLDHFRDKNINFNRSYRRKRGKASNPLFIMPDFFCIFQMNFAMATLGLKEMEKILWEGT